jgi:hypothetical protein
VLIKVKTSPEHTSARANEAANLFVVIAGTPPKNANVFENLGRLGK